MSLISSAGTALIMAAGATGFGIAGCSNTLPATCPPIPETTAIPNLSFCQTVIANSMVSCPLKEFQGIVCKEYGDGGDNDLRRMAERMHESGLLKCENHLPWQESFKQKNWQYEPIQPTDLKKSVMWGIVEGGDPFVALKTIGQHLARTPEDLAKDDRAFHGVLTYIKQWKPDEHKFGVAPRGYNYNHVFNANRKMGTKERGMDFQKGGKFESLLNGYEVVLSSNSWMNAYKDHSSAIDIIQYYTITLDQEKTHES